MHRCSPIQGLLVFTDEFVNELKSRHRLAVLALLFSGNLDAGMELFKHLVDGSFREASYFRESDSCVSVTKDQG